MHQKHKVFVSYHHKRDQAYADELRDFYGSNDTFIDRSLPEAFDSENNDYILGQIRNQHLKTSTVTIVLIGKETWTRKWVDWEIYSSLRPFGSRTVNGLLGILLPDAGRIPERFQDNYIQIGYPPNTAQVGYARLIQWNLIAPPVGWRNLYLTHWIQREIQEKRGILNHWVQQAFNSRTNTSIIQNGRPRYKNNRPIANIW